MAEGACLCYGPAPETSVPRKGISLEAADPRATLHPPTGVAPALTRMPMLRPSPRQAHTSTPAKQLGRGCTEHVLQGLLVACMMDADRLRTDARQEGEEQGDPMGEDGQPLPPQDGLSQHLLCKAYFDERATQCAHNLDVQYIVYCLSHPHSRGLLGQHWLGSAGAHNCLYSDAGLDLPVIHGPLAAGMWEGVTAVGAGILCVPCHAAACTSTSASGCGSSGCSFTTASRPFRQLATSWG